MICRPNSLLHKIATLRRPIIILALVGGSLLPLLPLFLWSFAQRWFFPYLLPPAWSLRAWQYLAAPTSQLWPAFVNSSLVALTVTLLALLIGLPAGRAVPLSGVYACIAEVHGRRYPAAVNIGVRPTFESETAAEKVEAHLLDFDGDIYNERVVLGFLDRLRGETRFDGVEALIAQIHADIEKTREVANESLS